MSNITKDQVIEWLSGQSIIDLAALVKDLEGKWGVSAAAAVAAAPAGGAPAAARCSSVDHFESRQWPNLGRGAEAASTA